MGGDQRRVELLALVEACGRVPELVGLFLVEWLAAIRLGLWVERPELLHLVRITPAREPLPAWLSSASGTVSSASRATRSSRGQRSAAGRGPPQRAGRSIA